MRRKSQEEVISQLFQENQVRHREIMGIVTNQALDAIVAQQIIEQIFAFAKAAPVPLLPMLPGASFPALLPEDHFWEPSLPAPGTAALQPFLLRVQPHL